MPLIKYSPAFRHPDAAFLNAGGYKLCEDCVNANREKKPRAIYGMLADNRKRWCGLCIRHWKAHWVWWWH